MDAFELLKADHQKVAKLFDRLEAASGKAKLNVFEQIKKELELHAEVEETIFYPALEKPEETHDLTLEAYDEHKVVKTLLAELAGSKSATEEWQAQVKVLRENVEHHVDEEENELFDKASDALNDEEIESLGERMEAAKAQKQGRSAPKPSPARGAGNDRRAKSDKSAKSGKSSGGKSIISRIADFVGLGSKPAKKKGGAASSKGAKKASAKKSAAAKKSPAASRGTKSNVKTGSKKAAKSTAASRSSSSGSKKASASRSTGSTKKRSGTASGKKFGKRIRNETVKKAGKKSAKKGGRGQ